MLYLRAQYRNKHIMTFYIAISMQSTREMHSKPFLPSSTHAHLYLTRHTQP